MRNKILSLLVLLLTAATGAWAADTYTITFSGFGNDACNKTVTDATLEYSETFNVTDVYANYTIFGGVGGSNEYVSISKSQDETQITITVKSAFEGTVNVTVYYMNENWDESERNISVTCVKSAPSLAVTWDAATKTGTFEMPSSDVVLTPIYAEAFIVSADGQTETAYETLKEAFLAVQNGETIKLDWDVTVTVGNDLMTGRRATDDPVKFTIDFNGFTLDGSSCNGTFMNTEHEGDEITFIDSSDAQTGGLKGMMSGQKNSFVFAGGRYDFAGVGAADIKELWSTMEMFGWKMADGMEFIDLNDGQADADGFYVRVALKTYELAIGAGQFATIYDDHNTVLADETAEGVGLYTITEINADRSEAILSQLSGVIAAGTPMLVFNSTEVEQLVKVKVSTDAASDAVAAVPEFKGTATDLKFTAEMMDAADYYALSGGKAFAKVYGTGTLAANQCWLEFTKEQAAGARSFKLVFEDSETTGIGLTPALSKGEGVVYDLSGRKVNGQSSMVNGQLKKGVYVINGRKVVK